MIHPINTSLKAQEWTNKQTVQDLNPTLDRTRVREHAQSSCIIPRLHSGMVARSAKQVHPGSLRNLLPGLDNSCVVCSLAKLQEAAVSKVACEFKRNSTSDVWGDETGEYEGGVRLLLLLNKVSSNKGGNSNKGNKGKFNLRDKILLPYVTLLSGNTLLGEKGLTSWARKSSQQVRTIWRGPVQTHAPKNLFENR